MASFIFSYHSAAQRLIMDGWMDGDHGLVQMVQMAEMVQMIQVVQNGPNGPPKWSE